MKEAFPQFAPDVRDGVIGFSGGFEGGSGKRYDVRTEAQAAMYPLQPPKVYVQPTEALPFLYLDGSVSMIVQWRPPTSTFAQMVLYAEKYLKDFG